MISESKRKAIYREVESIFPGRPNGSRVSGGGVTITPEKRQAPPGILPSDFGIRLRQQLESLKGEVISQILYLLHTFFIFSTEGDLVHHCVRDAVERLFDAESKCRMAETPDGASSTYSLLRQHWEKGKDVTPSSKLGVSIPLLTGFSHVEQAGFFRKQPLEIASWTRIFLDIERYHRSDPQNHEIRMDRLKALRTGTERHSLKRLEDLHIWLEHSLLGEMSKAGIVDLNRLSARLTQELESRIDPDLFAGLPLRAVLYVLLRSHQLCLSETWEKEDQVRLDRVHSTREFDSLLDLMRVVVQRTLRENRLPLVISVLDQLQEEGFGIKHEKFRDPYEISCVSLADTERLEMSRVPLFVNIDELSGDFDRDLNLGRETLVRLHQRILAEVMEEMNSYAKAYSQPLPQAHLVRRLVRFATSWFLASHPWPIGEPDSSWEDSIRALLPENVVRYLIRPRKGYELGSKQEFKRLMEEEGKKQWETLHRIARTRTIQGSHDYGVFARYSFFRMIQNDISPDPEKLQKDASLLASKSDLSNTPEWLISLASAHSIDATGRWAHPLDSIRDYFSGMTPAGLVAGSIETSSSGIDEELLREISATHYLLAVAFGRHQSNLPRLEVTKPFNEVIPALVRFLAPSLERLETIARRSNRQAFTGVKNRLYRAQCLPFIMNHAEWEAYVAWLAHRRIGPDLTAFLEATDLDRFLEDTAKDAEQSERAPGSLSLETVRSTFLSLLGRGDESADPDAGLLAAVHAVLPQLDCGACGEPDCLHFARSLLRGRKEPSGCVQLPAPGLSRVVEILSAMREDGQGAKPDLNPLGALQELSQWLKSPHRESFESLFSPEKRKARRLFLDRWKRVWEELPSKPEIFKCPDSESFYQELCRYVGYESAERLTDAERRLLVEQGNVREESEWNALKQRQDWLSLAARNRQGRPLLLSRDPLSIAQYFYGEKLFLHQLSPRDRKLVLQYRLEHWQDGFRRWWNEDLLTMKHPEFSIHDWEDFTKIIKNAYWHQESSLAPGDALVALEKYQADAGGDAADTLSGNLFADFLERLVEQEVLEFDMRRTALKGLRSGGSVTGMSELRMFLEGLADEDPQGALSLSGTPTAQDDLLSIARQSLWNRFQTENVLFSREFSCRWSELSQAEQEAIALEMGAEPGGRQGQGDGVFFLEEWSGSLVKRAALIRALIAGIIRSRAQERVEWQWFNKQIEGSSSGRPPIGSFRVSVRHLLKSGAGPDEVKRRMGGILEAIREKKDLFRAFQGDMLHTFLRRRAYSLLQESLISRTRQTRDILEDRILNSLPDLKDAVDRILYKQPRIDHDRLLHYLFLLAKMEGNLDTLTALLREIRETSDIIEAAWLRFTEERILEGPPPKTMPEERVGIQLLVSGLQDKEAVNLCLRRGVGRREKRNVAAAANELLNFLRFHLLILAKDSESTLPGKAVEELLASGYDLTGIDEDALKSAAERESARMAPLKNRKIWIFTTVTARKLAAQHPELNEIERQFQKIRLDILKADGHVDDRHALIISRRGVALGQIKEEMYRQLSDLLESERVATFQSRIRQIVDQLDDKREEIFAGWNAGTIDRRTVFYILRQYQKHVSEPSWEDFLRFLVEHWMMPVADLRCSSRADRHERIREIDEKMQALLGASPLVLEEEAAREAERDFEEWVQDQVTRIQAECI